MKQHSIEHRESHGAIDTICDVTKTGINGVFDMVLDPLAKIGGTTIRRTAGAVLKTVDGIIRG